MDEQRKHAILFAATILAARKLNRNGRPYAANKVVEYGLWPVLDKLKIERAGMHAFRHCHASLLMDVGANPTVTKTQMRHSDARVTLGIYSHVIGDSQRPLHNFKETT